MSQYVQISTDGTRTVVNYNPRNDGPVSRRISALKNVKWLSRWCETHPGDFKAKRRLAEAQRLLNQLSANTSGTQSQSSRQSSVRKRRRRPNRTSKASSPLETVSLLQTQQRPGLTTQERPAPGQRESVP